MWNTNINNNASHHTGVNNTPSYGVSKNEKNPYYELDDMDGIDTDVGTAFGGTRIKPEDIQTSSLLPYKTTTSESDDHKNRPLMRIENGVLVSDLDPVLDKFQKAEEQRQFCPESNS